MTNGPLTGLHVLDLSRVLAAPYATMALGELGADIIKVERASQGDDTRQWGPPFVAGESTYYLGINRNKRSIALNLQNESDREIVRDLSLGWADIVVENFRPGTLERWGMGLDSLRQANPRLITATVRGYPAGDDRPGYDFVIQAGAGLMSITGDVDGPPVKVGVAVADIITGLFLLSGIEAALYRREKMGRGDHVEASLWESQLAALATIVQGHLSTGQSPRRWGNAHAQLAPYQIFPTRDGWIALGVGNEGQFEALCQVLGHGEWSRDPRFLTNRDRVNNRDDLQGLLTEVLQGDATTTWVDRLEAVGVPAGPVRTVPEALAFAQAKGHGVIGSLSHPTLGSLEQIRLPWRFDESAAAMRLPPPLLDEHREQILELVQRIRRSPERTGLGRHE